MTLGWLIIGTLAGIGFIVFIVGVVLDEFRYGEYVQKLGFLFAIVAILATVVLGIVSAWMEYA